MERPSYATQRVRANTLVDPQGSAKPQLIRTRRVRIDVPALRAYARAVYANTDAYLAALTAEDLDQPRRRNRSIDHSGRHRLGLDDIGGRGAARADGPASSPAATTRLTAAGSATAASWPERRRTGVVGSRWTRMLDSSGWPTGVRFRRAGM